jgi:hypothetical protein
MGQWNPSPYAKLLTPTPKNMNSGTICKNCNQPLGWHIIPKNNCPYGHSYITNQFFQELTEQDLYLAERRRAIDEGCFAFADGISND